MAVVGFEEEVEVSGAASGAIRWVVGTSLAGTTDHALLMAVAGAVLGSTARPMVRLPDRDQVAEADTLEEAEVGEEEEATTIAMVDATATWSHGLLGMTGIVLRVLVVVAVVGIRVGRRGLTTVAEVVDMTNRDPGAGTDRTGRVGLHRQSCMVRPTNGRMTVVR